ncbi:serine/threonine-protein kinase PknK [Hyalangium minutum]|uniref:Protein kinase domain-containing protein n=1 Tax=Hyalangium minutum TaxID=394096 RepID=A0A085WR48_9BACT|nr:protein kinase [Hyalangium minutum]KFE70161.1 hypothetical protein DB31_5203 [Hyalangium minutum]
MVSASPPSETIAPGTVIAGRFALQRLAGQGGVGLVYQARDTQTGGTVALKLLHTIADPESARRFVREAEFLAGLHHPGIVSYVAHGLTEEHQPFLAMEWLEGEDVARRLARQPLALSETLGLLRRVAEVLAITHARGIIHRDIKPSNLFLRGGRAEDVVLLDFGLARVSAASQALTGSAMVVGTPGYMAPEQASSNPELTPGADIFSLGCVLYECLCGHPPFRAPHIAAVLAKILFADPPSLHTFRVELPISLQVLVDQMLAKAPEKRLKDGQELLRTLEKLEMMPELPPPDWQGSAPAMSRLTNTEQHLVSVVLATPTVSARETLTMTSDESHRMQQVLTSLKKELKSHQARAAVLADGSLLATFVLEHGTATDQAALAAHCALVVKERLPESFVALTTGLSLRSAPMPVGDVADRAGELLRQLEGISDPASAQVMLDETTAGLLGPRFQLDKDSSGRFLLRGEHLSGSFSLDESRPLLGRPTRCVGREQELSLLDLAFNTCMEDSTARALLVTAPAGTGKSRLRSEFLRRLEQRGYQMLALFGRGDPMNAGSAYGLLGQALRELCGVMDREPVEACREKLLQRLTRYLMPEQRKDTVEFLGELCEVPFPAEDSPKLRAAREDPRLMRLQVARALVAFLRAETSQGPLLLVLEDLHWSDAPTVKLVDEVLRELNECPLMVLALGRPEVKELFPGLWGQSLQEVPLRGLTPRASTQLAQEVLGRQVPEAVVARLVEQAAGNALFLEELIRGVAEGRGEETPGTVLAILQSRLQRLDPGLRRVLRAASIFGRTFWTGGVQALLEGEFSTDELERSLRHLIVLELVQPQQESRFSGESEYRFRHALARDAAYGLVPDDLKPLGHRLAGTWLEQAGEPEPLVLARHYQLGHERAKAVQFSTRAGERLFERHDLKAAQQCLESALACAPEGADLLPLRALEAAIAFWREDFERSFTAGSEILPRLTAGSAPWSRVISGLLLASAQSGRHGEVARLGQQLLDTAPDAHAGPLYVAAACFLAAMNTWSGQKAGAASVLDRIQAVSAGFATPSRVAQAWTESAQGYFDHFLSNRPWQALVHSRESERTFREVGSDLNETAAQALMGLTLEAMGEAGSGIEVLRKALAVCQQGEHRYAAAGSRMHLVLVLSGSAEPGHQEEAGSLARQILETEKPNLLHQGVAHVALSKVALAQGDLTVAEGQARRACDLLAVLMPFHLLASRSLCMTLLAQGHVQEARAVAERGVLVLEKLGGEGSGAVGTWLSLVEACLAQGETAAAEKALRKAQQSLAVRARDIPDPVALERFLSQVPENARTREWVRQRWGTDWDGAHARVP